MSARRLRVALAGIYHETNTFATVPATRAAFDAGTLRGAALLERYGDSHHPITGFVEACAGEPVELVPLLYAHLNPCGMVEADAFEALAGELLGALAQQGPFDVVLLAQHGAAVSAEHADADGELVARVRAAVGPAVTVGVVLDLHANVTGRMVESADVVVGYRENPHTDPRPRGLECARLALAAARGELRPVQRLVRLPMVVPILGGWTGGGPMRELMEDAARVAVRHGLRSRTVFHGFGYADVPQLGASVLAVADGDADAAERAAQALARLLWERREQLRGDALPTAAAVAEAWRRSADARPLVLLDVGDNVGGGSPGDSTVLLAEALAQGAHDLVATLCDARAVEQAIAAGEGAELELELGATTRASVGPRLALRGRVARVSKGRFEDPNPTHGGFRFHDGGPTVRFATAEGAELIVTSRALATRTPEQLRAVGIDPRAHRLIVAKGVVAPRAGYAGTASDFLLADTPGVTTADLARFAYAHRPRPLWPLEPHAAFD